jgi:hypothetical protein
VAGFLEAAGDPGGLAAEFLGVCRVHAHASRYIIGSAGKGEKAGVGVQVRCPANFSCG